MGDDDLENPGLRSAHLPAGAERILAKYTAAGMASRPVDGRFDPFTDRLSRDIRNSLSLGLAEALERNDSEIFRGVIERWRTLASPAACRDYLERRLARYEALWQQIRKDQLSDPLARVVMAWNLCLYFECHELLEALWHHSRGSRSRALQALIQAAGVYIHLAAGHDSAARKLARKAREGLIRHGRTLGEVGNLDLLLERLARVDAAPCRLQFLPGSQTRS